MLLLLISLLLASGSAQPTTPDVTLQCDVGPVERTFGNGPWKVFSCSDGKTLVLISANSKSNLPFSYFVTFEEGRALVSGSGVPGSGTDVAAATQELRQLTAEDFAALMSATKAHGTAPRGPAGD